VLSGVTTPAELLTAAPQHRPTFLAADVGGLVVEHPAVEPAGPHAWHCRGWTATVHADHTILLETGAEVISGSTRMGAGTAQKAALGMLSSLLMTRLGHVHDGLMVSMRVDCSKLEGRAGRIVAALADCTTQRATQALAASENRIKPAVLIARGADVAQADTLLTQAGGNLRVALGLLEGAD
jgi:N-acetylmuramic acid 6-phosphate etherase